MVLTDYIAFGYKITKVVLVPGDRSPQKSYVGNGLYFKESQYNPNLTREDYLKNKIYNEILLVTSGYITATPVHTMVPLEYKKGYCNLDQLDVVGMCFDTVIEETTVFCIEPYANIQLNNDPIMPDVSVLRWSAGDVIEPPVKFFLADGSFKKDTNVFSTSGAYSLSTGNIEILTDCLGFVFNS